jgi:hypothetical protein
VINTHPLRNKEGGNGWTNIVWDSLSNFLPPFPQEIHWHKFVIDYAFQHLWLHTFLCSLLRRTYNVHLFTRFTHFESILPNVTFNCLLKLSM